MALNKVKMAPEHVDRMTHNLAFLGSLAPKRCPSRTAIPVENPLENDFLKKRFVFCAYLFTQGSSTIMYWWWEQPTVQPNLFDRAHLSKEHTLQTPNLWKHSACRECLFKKNNEFFVFIVVICMFYLILRIRSNHQRLLL